MNLKALMEKRNDLLNQAEALVNTAEKEIRSLTGDEATAFAQFTKQIEDLNSQIKNLEARQLDGAKQENMEERTMEKTQMEIEVRGLEQFLRKQDGEEVRTLQKTTNGEAVIPENVEGMIVEKMEETSPAFARARKFPSVAGTLKIAKETALSAAGFVGEGTDVQELAISLDDVKLTQKRVGAALSLSNQLINDAAVNLVDYSVDLLARRTVKAVEKSMFVGTGVEQFAGIKTAAGVTEVDASTGGASPVTTLDQLIDMYNAVHPSFLDGAEWYMSRQYFNRVAKLKDGNGHPYVQNGVINGKLTYTLFGAPIVVSDVIDKGTAADEVPVYFGNIFEAYAIMIKKGFSLQHVAGDTTQALRGSQLLVMDGYMDGAVYNEQAIVRGVARA